MARMQKTTVARKDDLDRRWWFVDAEGRVLGRLATRIATVLMGKHKPSYTPFLDTGDFVIVVNAQKVRLTGKKLDQKVYQRYSGYPSGRKTQSARQVLRKHPHRVVEEAVRRMLPKTKLGRAMYKKLKVYAGESHPHAAQKPEQLPLE